MTNLITVDKLPLFLKPDKVEKLLGISIKTLRDGVKNGLYKKGKHYHIPKGKKYTYWDTKSLFEWMVSDSSDDEVTNIVNDILKLS